MLKQVINYTNFNDEEKTREVYFHLGKPDIARIAANPRFLEEMQDAVIKQDKSAILAKIEYLVRLAYGVRSEDGERFIKTAEIQDEFMQSAAYEEFLIQLVTTEDGFTKFIQGVLPAKAMKELQEMINKGEVADPFKEPEKVIKTAAALSEQTVTEVPDDRPAWQRENRVPTKAELLAMPKEEMMLAFRTYPRLVDL